MCHSHINNRKMDRFHKRYPSIFYNSKQSSLKELFENDSSVSVHERNVQVLATEIYKVINDFPPTHINKIFEIRNEHPYNLRQNFQFSQPLVKSVYYRTEYIPKHLQK